MKKQSQNLLIFLGLIVVSVSLHYFKELSIIQTLFKPFEVFFHEISHAIVAFSGGRDITSFGLKWEGSGLVNHIGVSNNLVVGLTSFAGYFGAALWGLFIYASALYSLKSVKIVMFILALIACFFIENLETLSVLLYIMAVLFALWKIGITKYEKISLYLLRFIGIFSIVSAIYSPTYLFHYDQLGDHVSLSESVGFPPTLWIVLWIAFALIALFIAYKVTAKKATITSPKQDDSLKENAVL